MPAPPDTTGRQEREAHWQSLMRSAQDGDGGAYARLLTELLPLLRGIVRRKWQNRQDVEDIVQEIIISLHSVRHTYDPSRPFVPWLMTIAYRRIADAGRQRASHAGKEILTDTVPETFEGQPTKSGQEHSDDRDTVKQAMSVLSNGQREAIELVKIKELTLEEASAVCGKSVVSLKVSVHRALKAMRAHLERKN